MSIRFISRLDVCSHKQSLQSAHAFYTFFSHFNDVTCEKVRTIFELPRNISKNVITIQNSVKIKRNDDGVQQHHHHLHHHRQQQQSCRELIGMFIAAAIAIAIATSIAMVWANNTLRCSTDIVYDTHNTRNCGMNEMVRSKIRGRLF